MFSLSCHQLFKTYFLSRLDGWKARFSEKAGRIMGREPKNYFILIRECFLSNLEPLVYIHKRRFSLGDLSTRFRKMI